MCLSVPDQCEEFKVHLQKLMDRYVVQFSRVQSDDIIYVIMLLFDQNKIPKAFVIPCQRNAIEELAKKIESMVVHVPTLFPFDITKVVPLNQNTTVYVGNKPIVLKELNVTNIDGSSSITRSGRVFHPDVGQKKVVEKVEKPLNRKDDVLNHEKGYLREP